MTAARAPTTSTQRARKDHVVEAACEGGLCGLHQVRTTGDGAYSCRAHCGTEGLRVFAGRGRQRVLDAVLEKGAERRDPDRHPGEAEGVADPRGHPGSRRIHHAESAGRKRGIRDPDADASDDEACEECRPARVGTEPVHQREPCGDERETGADHHPEGHARGQTSRHERHEEDESGERQETEARRKR